MTILGFILVVGISGFSGYHYRDRGCVKFSCPTDVSAEIEKNEKINQQVAK